MGVSGDAESLEAMLDWFESELKVRLVRIERRCGQLGRPGKLVAAAFARSMAPVRDRK